MAEPIVGNIYHLILHDNSLNEKFLAEVRSKQPTCSLLNVLASLFVNRVPGNGRVCHIASMVFKSISTKEFHLVCSCLYEVVNEEVGAFNKSSPQEAGESSYSQEKPCTYTHIVSLLAQQALHLVMAISLLFSTAQLTFATLSRRFPWCSLASTEPDKVAAWDRLCRYGGSRRAG